MSKYSYSKSGVDIDKGNKFVENIKKTIKNDKKKTTNESVIGGFAGLYMPSHINNPVLVSGTDGVGTKLKLAFELNKHDTRARSCCHVCE